MLEQVDLKLSIKKSEYKKLIEPLGYRLDELERLCRFNGIPIVVVFEGWEASGKGSCINRLMRAIDPRNFKVHYFHIMSREELLRPYLWRFAIRVPSRGFMSIFDRSWYQRVLEDRIEEKIPDYIWRDTYYEIETFERQLIDDGYVLIKFWLHISREEQKRRFKKMEKDPMEAWKITPDDWQQHLKYSEYCFAIEEMLQKTSTSKAPWTIIEAEDKYFAWLKIFETLRYAMENALA
ncbi:phosphate--AMP phosphotransferase, partial [bacterium]|nr:phosphate--AMP phosphotransferase [candidate division CSSED10-310 bacterium]